MPEQPQSGAQVMLLRRALCIRPLPLPSHFTHRKLRPSRAEVLVLVEVLELKEAEAGCGSRASRKTPWSLWKCGIREHGFKSWAWRLSQVVSLAGRSCGRGWLGEEGRCPRLRYPLGLGGFSGCAPRCPKSYVECGPWLLGSLCTLVLKL